MDTVRNDMVAISGDCIMKTHVSLMAIISRAFDRFRALWRSNHVCAPNARRSYFAQTLGMQSSSPG
jgi:hypothetical protein